MQPNRKILFLESLRGIAATCIVLYHSHLPELVDSALVDNLPFMVDFFFVLSGYVIALNYQDRIHSLRDICDFQLRRFLRLYPLHFVLLLVFLVLEISKYLVEVEFGLVAANAAFTKNNMESFLHNVFLTQNLFLDYLSWNFVSWSISAEFFTYVVFALVMFATRYVRFVMPAICCVVVVASLLYLLDRSFTSEHGLVRCFYSFFMGVIVCNASQSLGQTLSRYLSYFLTMAAGLALIFATQETAAIVPVLFSLLILSLVSSEDGNRVITFMNAKCLVYLGTISYGIYMIHLLVWWAITQTLRFVFKFPAYLSEGGFTVIAFDSNLMAYAILAVGLVMVFLLAHWSYHLIEMPVNKMRHKITLIGTGRRARFEKSNIRGHQTDTATSLRFSEPRSVTGAGSKDCR